MRLAWKCLIAAAATAAALLGQADSFEVASVKPGDPSFNGMSMRSSPGRVSLTNVTVKFLIGYAWKLQRFQIEGAPGWADSQLFTIDAEAPDDDFERRFVRMRHLLEERFALKTHEATRVMPAYALVIAKGGPKLMRVEGPATEGITTGPGLVKVDDGTVGMLAENLARQIGRPVIDRTGIEGAFNMGLKWISNTEAADANGPSLFTAIQEQLGLKLARRKRR